MEFQAFAQELFTLEDIKRMLDQSDAMRNPLRDKALIILL